MSSSTTSMPGPSSGSQSSSSNTLSSTVASTLNEDSSSQSRDSMSQQSNSESSSSLTRPTTPSTSALNTSILTPNSTLPQTSSYSTTPTTITSTPSSQTSSINSIMNFIYPNYQSQQQHHHLNMDTGNVLESSASMSVAAAISGASATLADEPELKKVKLSHFHSYYQNQLFNDSLKQANLHMSSKLMSSAAAAAASSMSNNIYMVHKKLEERIGGILCCTVCLDLPQTVIYQCNNGHLMCAGCFSHLLADARLKDEQATCPNCRCEISKTSCSRNLAVEKTLSELPASCCYCNVMYPRNCLDQHQRNECLERPTKCIYERIGCTWDGPYHELNEHSEQCVHPNRPCKEIIGFLKEKDACVEEEYQALGNLVNYLSYEKVCFNDLQFKQYKTDDITPKLYFETNRFGAFFHQWVLKARVNDNQKNPNLSLNRFISFQLILKSRLNGTQPNLEVKFCVLKGPFGEVPINARVQTFEFSQNKLETDYIKLDIKSSDCNKLLASKIINFRFFMFQI